MSVETLPDEQHLARVGRLQSLSTADELLSPDDRRWLKPAQLSALHRARFERWLAANPTYFAPHEKQPWCDWLHDAEYEALKAGTLTREQRKDIAADLHRAMGSLAVPTPADIAAEMRSTFAKWWSEIGCDAARQYGDHAAERSQRVVLEQHYETHVADQPAEQQARLRERRDAFAALGVDMVAVTALWDDTSVIEHREPADLAQSYALSDAEWSVLAPYFGEEKQQRKNSVSWRQALDAALLVSCTRTPWRAVPNASALRQRLQQAADAGVFGKIKRALDDGSLTVRPDRLRRVVEMMAQWAQKNRKG